MLFRFYQCVESAGPGCEVTEVNPDNEEDACDACADKYTRSEERRVGKESRSRWSPEP